MMRVSIPGLAVASGAALFVASAAFANTVNVSNDIAVSTTWTKNNVYNLTKQIYVLPGATLTIEPGTVIASVASATGSGSLAVTRGAKIIADGTRQNPIIFTSNNDVATWSPLASHPTGKDPKTGVWREAANEWGNLTILGRAYISNGPGTTQFVPGNTATFNANNVFAMEGLVAAFPGDPNVLCGGGDDDDDSGVLRYVSLRYGGRVVGLGDELNGISIGAVGRQTKIEYLDIMNNVDDGIEIWGGTVNVKYLSIWNIGDDSFDVDCGWRGKAQFGLIVQGWSLDAPSGSGVADKVFELDGAQDSDAQPVTTATLYNFTAIGQPLTTSPLTGFRDNARIQFRQSVFMDMGAQVVRFDNQGDNGSKGYGHNGTLSWADTWTTNWNVFSAVNAPANPAQFYTAQTNGKLIDFRDNVFFRNLAANAYTEANNRGVFAPANNNVLIPGFDDADRPIQNVVRGPVVTKGGRQMIQVVGLNPRARAGTPAEVAAETAPNDGFYTPVNFRGAVGLGANANWLCDWTAARAFGFVTGQCPQPVNCPADLSGNGSVGPEDLSILLGAWGGAGAADLSGNGSVGPEDLSVLLGAWGACPS